MKDGSRGHNEGRELRGAYSPAGQGLGRVIGFERKPPKAGRLVAVGGRSGELFRETGPGKKV